MGKHRKSIGSDFYQVVVTTCPETGVQVAEEWSINGTPHREGGPAAILRDRHTGVIYEECWMRNGEFSRDDGPALIKRDKKTGRIVGTKYATDGKLEHLYRKPDVNMS